MKSIPRISLTVVAAASAMAILVSLQQEPALAAPGSSGNYLKNPQTGGLQLQSASSLSFGPGGLLLVAEPRSGSVLAIETGDTGPLKKLAASVADIASVVAAGLGSTAENVKINDLAVNPASGRIYLAVSRKPDNATVIVTISSGGEASALDLDHLRWARAALPGGTASKVTHVTDVAFADDRIVAAGSCNEEFASKIFSVPLPLEHGSQASIFSAETYHVAHRKWETRAPISSFVCDRQGGKPYVVGAFACTPIAKFPIGDLQSGAQVKGVSMVELGSGNRPLDMFTYSKGGKSWLVTHTQRFKANLFGPSSFWGARLDMALLKPDAADKTNENAVRRDVSKNKDENGIEVVDALFGAVQADKLSDEEAVVLRDNSGKLALEIIALP